MADVRMTMIEVAASDDIDRARIATTTGDDIRRYMIEDGEDPDEDPPAAVRVVHAPASLRAKLGLSEVEMALRLRVPLTTWQGWEAGRLPLDPAARALLDLVADDPERAFRVLGTLPAAAE